MSIRWQNLVYDRGPDNRTWHAVLLVLADFANNDSGISWPAVATIARRARVCPRTVYRVLLALEADGWITRVSGGGRHLTNHYQLVAKRFSTTPRNGDTVTPLLPRETVTATTETVTATTQNGDKPCHPIHQIRQDHHHPEPEPMLPTVFGSVATDDDDSHTSDVEAVMSVFEGLPVVIPQDVRSLALARCNDGWLPSDLNRYLFDNVNPSRCDSVVAVVRSLLKNLPLPPTMQSSRPAWCGECDETTRLLDYHGDRPRRCPTCHPLAVSA